MNAALLVLALALDASSLAGPWRLEGASVEAACTLTVGGRFEARSTALTGELAVASEDPAAFDGELSLDLRTLQTDIALRDAHLRDEYLEVGRGPGFSHAVLSGISLPGAAAADVKGRTAFRARLLLHGVTREVRGEAEIQRDGPAARVEATFPVRLGDHAIKSPRYLGVGVRDEVIVKVSLRVRAAGAP
jgi:polyisoprenoid-binding protein YceI